MKKLLPEKFPRGLDEIPGPPKFLYIVGKLPPEGYKYLIVVGSRRLTSYGIDATRALIRGLAGYPVVIVSGLAQGIDTIALTAGLDAGLRTIAFPGSGLDPEVIVPSSNRLLAERIVSQGGCLLSEYDPTFPAAEWTFPQRNRLMAGMAHAVLIVEAAMKSGTMITARLALDYNRDVLAVPGSIFSPVSVGTHYLIKNGATPITSSSDLLTALGFAPGSTSARTAELDNCSPLEKKILEVLANPAPRDEIIRTAGLPAPEVNTTLSIMELKGLIKEEYGEIRRT